VIRARRLAPLIAAALTAYLAIPAWALAADGVGIGGRTDDRKVTYWGFGVMIFFVLVVVAMSLLQGRLEGRKERIQVELERLRRP